MIFRKVTEVQREQELERKRKSKPDIDLREDHPVYRMCRGIQKRSKVDEGDAEKGEIKVKYAPVHVHCNALLNVALTSWCCCAGESGFNGALVKQVHTASSQDEASPRADGGDGGLVWFSGPSASHARAKHKWHNLVTGKGVHTDEPKNSATLPLVQVGSEAASPRLADRRLTTVEEETSFGRSASTRQQPPLTSGDRETRDDGVLTARDVDVSVADVSTMSPREQNLLASLHDIRLELRDEEEAFAQRMRRIDERIQRILLGLSSSSTPRTSSAPDSDASANRTPVSVASDSPFATKTDVTSEQTTEKSKQSSKRSKRDGKKGDSSTQSGSGRESASSRSDTPPSRAGSRSSSAKMKRSRVAPHDVTAPGSASSAGTGDVDASSGDVSIPTTPTPTQLVTSASVDDDERVPFQKRDLDLM